MTRVSERRGSVSIGVFLKNVLIEEEELAFKILSRWSRFSIHYCTHCLTQIGRNDPRGSLVAAQADLVPWLCYGSKVKGIVFLDCG